MSPWIVGFTVFFGYPLVMTVYLSFNALRPAELAAVHRARELPLLLGGFPGSTTS